MRWKQCPRLAADAVHLGADRAGLQSGERYRGGETAAEELVKRSGGLCVWTDAGVWPAANGRHSSTSLASKRFGSMRISCKTAGGMVESTLTTATAIPCGATRPNCMPAMLI